MALGVHVAPRAGEAVLDAVRAGGGEPVDVERAEALVWLGFDAERLLALLHDGIRWVQLPRAGIEDWLAGEVVDDERLWTTASEAYAGGVAEHVVALLLAGRRRLHDCARATSWNEDNGGQPLFGATIVLVGTGSIGRAVMRLLAPWGMRFLGVSRSGASVEGAERVVRFAELTSVLPEADAVVIAAPSTPETKGLVGREELAAMASRAWLINVARGALVDTDALVEALAAGSIAGAGLDVTDPEPLPDGHPLWSEPRAIITPHRANFGEAADAALFDLVTRQIRRYVAGEELSGRVDTARGY